MNYGLDVTAVSRKVVPFTDLDRAPAWEAGMTVAEGAYVRAGIRCYMALAAGVTGANMPFGRDIVNDGVIDWLLVQHTERHGLMIVNDGSATVYLSMHGSAVLGKGIRLNAGGGAITLSGDASYQGEISAVVGSGSSHLTIALW